MERTGYDIDLVVLIATTLSQPYSSSNNKVVGKLLAIFKLLILPLVDSVCLVHLYVMLVFGIHSYL